MSILLKVIFMDHPKKLFVNSFQSQYIKELCHVFLLFHCLIYTCVVSTRLMRHSISEIVKTSDTY